MKKQVLLLFAALVFSQVAFAYDFSAVTPSGQALYYRYYGSNMVCLDSVPSEISGALIIPDSVTYGGTTYVVYGIDGLAFNSCSGLTSITIPNSIGIVGTGAFYNCSGLTSVVFNAENCSISGGMVGVPVFYNCPNITNLTIGGNVHIIPYGFCWGLSGLTSVTIPNSVGSIGRSAFANCSGLTSITIPESVSYIGDGAFSGCSGLTSVAFNANSCTYMGGVGEYNTPVFNDCNNITTLSIGDSVKVIPNYAFYGCSGFTSITIPNAVTYIGDGAFGVCSLTSVTFNADSCTYMGSSYSPVFVGCSSLTTLTIGNNVKVIPDFAFYGRSALTSVTIPNSVIYIGVYAFALCSGLTSVTIPNSVTSIGEGVFSMCSGLTSVNIPNFVVSIGSGAFFGCSSLTSVAFNADSCTYMGGYDFSGSYVQRVFEGCSSLDTLTIGNNVKVIPSYAFYGCSGLTSVIIPNSVISIGSEAFRECSGLTSAIIPNSVTSIGSEAFRECSGLTLVTIGNTINSIGNNAFTNCSNVQELTFLNPTPPQFGTDVFEGVPSGIPVNVPCGSLALYYARLTNFNNFVELQFEFSAISENENKGTVQVLTEPSCTNHNAVLYAVPASGYRFDHWSTGSTDNPYTLTVVVDTVITAYFVSEGGTEGVDDVEGEDIQVIVSNGRIVVEGVEQKDIQVYDITGRITNNRALPSGVYIVKIGQLPARKVVVIN